MGAASGSLCVLWDAVSRAAFRYDDVFGSVSGGALAQGETGSAGWIVTPAVWGWVERSIRDLDVGDRVRAGIFRPSMNVVEWTVGPDSFRRVDLKLVDGELWNLDAAFPVERWERVDAGGGS